MKCSIPLREFNFLLDNSNLKMLETSFFVIYLGVLIYPSLYKSCRKEGSKSFVISSVTFTILEAVNPPSSVVTVIAVCPCFSPLMMPSGLTDATSGFEDDQVTFLLDALFGVKIRSNFPRLSSESPIVNDSGARLTPATGTTTFLNFATIAKILLLEEMLKET